MCADRSPSFIALSEFPPLPQPNVVPGGTRAQRVLEHLIRTGAASSVQVLVLLPWRRRGLERSARSLQLAGGAAGVHRRAAPRARVHALPHRLHRRPRAAGHQPRVLRGLPQRLAGPLAGQVVDGRAGDVRPMQVSRPLPHSCPLDTPARRAADTVMCATVVLASAAKGRCLTATSAWAAYPGGLGK